MRKYLSIALGVLGLLGAAAPSASADTISYSGQYVTASTHDGAGTAPYQTAFNEDSGSVSVSAGTASATTSWNLTATTATFAFDGVTAGAHESYAVHESNFYFTVDADTTYSISGSYSFADLDDSIVSNEYAMLFCILFDETAQEYVFGSSQYTFAADEGTYYLGGTSEDSWLSGSLSGTLLAGHEYRFLFDASVQNYPSDGNDAVIYGSGSVTLTIVPLPPSALMGLTLLGGLGLAKILRKRRQSALA